METVRTTYPPSGRLDAQAARPRPGVDAGATAASVDTSAARAPTPVRVKSASEDTREQLEELLQQVSDRIQPESRSLSFRVNEDIDGVVVSVIDAETEELIRQIPAEAMVRIAETLRRMEASSTDPGMLLTEKA